MKKGIENEKVEVVRSTKESKAKVVLNSGAKGGEKIETGLAFLDHMIETIAWRAGVNAGLEFKTKKQLLAHVIAEDSGITFGRAFAELATRKRAVGINGCGSATGIIDEAMSVAAVSIEGRANCFVERNCAGARLERVEDMASADLAAFLEGFAQGAKATVRVNIERGEDPHHAWESAFRALGEAIALVLGPNEFRKGSIAGIKGTVE
ncbi:MAG: hypothetical protein ABH854_02235 [Candidatus Diapherotrites archaeon]|nr:hypothetical protein [Candidatus Micrarchaeota archaeon]MBU1940057.1 hypothetical protein [Candidatus Micrarchaeota archaeon]